MEKERTIRMDELAVAPRGPKSARARSRGRDEKGDEASLGSLLKALQAVRNGDFSARLPTDQVGLPGKIADAFNDIVLG